MPCYIAECAKVRSVTDAKATLLQVVRTGSGNGDCEASTDRVTRLAPQQCKADAVALPQPSAPVPTELRATDAETLTARDNSMLDKLLPVGITTYTEVRMTPAERDLEHLGYTR